MVALARLVLSLAAALALTGHPTPASNRQAAYRDAGRLVHLAVLPPDARRVRSGRRSTFQVPAGTKRVDRYAFWRVPEPLDSVVAFVRAHRPRGSQKSGSGYGTGGGPNTPPNEDVFFAFPAQPGRTSFRWLDVSLVARPDGSTAVKVDAQEIWIVPRPATEVVPPGVREIDIRSPRRSWRVTTPRRVAKIVRWFDRLPTVQPGIFSCLAFVPPLSVTLAFRGANGRLLARARSPVVSGPCSPTRFSIGGRPQKSLLGGRFFFLHLRRLVR